MKRLIAILGLVAAVAVSVGAASVLAHDGGDQGQNTTNACTTPSGSGGDEGGGGDRMSAADHRAGPRGDDKMDGTSRGDDEKRGPGEEEDGGRNGDEERNSGDG